MPTLNQIKSSITEIDNAIHANGEEYRNQINQVKENPDLNEHARNQKVNSLELERTKQYSKLQKQKSDVVSNGIKSIGKQVYSGGELKDPIGFDLKASELSAKNSKELNDLLTQDLQEETLRAVLKASVTSKKYDVLEKAASLYPNRKDRISDFFEIEQEFGGLESRTSKLTRRMQLTR